MKEIRVDKKEIAIVIPAYKSKFLAETLDSIVRQTDQNFMVYVGDDCSPDPIETIVRKYSKIRLIKYHRFENHLGQTALVEHWERCISLSEEQWVWLFSDDDIMEPKCIEALREKIKGDKGRCEVLRFDSALIDKEGSIYELNQTSPEYETWFEFLYFWLRNLRRCTMPEWVFSREAFQKIGGFIRFPLAWGSDVATIILLAKKGGISTIKGPKVFFRQSGTNISSFRDRKVFKKKIEAEILFVNWLHSLTDSLDDSTFPLNKKNIKELSRIWFLERLRAHHIFMDPYEINFISNFLSDTWGYTKSRSFARLLFINLEYILHRILLSLPRRN